MRVVLCPEQIVTVAGEIETDGVVFTVMVRVLDVAGLPVTQLALLVITQEMVFPFARAAFE